jgi:alanine racemase
MSDGDARRQRGGRPVTGTSTRALIDLEALRANYRTVRGYAGGVPVMAVVKADAYGHGVEHAVPVFRKEGAEMFGVASVPEGARLRELGVEEPILVFGSPLEEYLPLYETHGLDLTVASGEIADAIVRDGRRVRVHVKVDTGMHRLGLGMEEAPAVVARLSAASHVEVAALWTHFATSDAADLRFAREQIERFDAVAAEVGSGIPTHLANSGALVQLPAAVDGRALVRPGGLLYGLTSSDPLERQVSVRPVMRLVSRVVHVHTVASGEGVSYGCTWRASRASRIATIAAGYADGLPRQWSNRGQVCIRGRRYPIVGRVCMDMLMVDLGPPAGVGMAVGPGDEVLFFGDPEMTAAEAADWAGTMAYTLPTGLTARVPRETESGGASGDERD